MSQSVCFEDLKAITEMNSGMERGNVLVIVRCFHFQEESHVILVGGHCEEYFEKEFSFVALYY